jgi:predicted metal-dependent hydrolase
MQGYRRGIQLINRQEYFEAHEVLEDVWRAGNQGDRKFLQGLVQVAVGFVHYTRGNMTGALSLLRRARGNLSGVPPDFIGFDHQALLETLSTWEQALVNEGPYPRLPQIELTP